MLRFRLLAPCAATVCGGWSVRCLSISNDARETLTKHLSSVKEESKSQGLDLADMSDTMKVAAHSLQDAVRKSDISDAQFKGKMTTLSASLKVYNTRLANLQNEARSLQADVNGLLKLLWGTENPQGASFSSPPNPAGDSSDPEGFAVDPPPMAKILEQEPQPGVAEPKVEKVEAERVDASAAATASKEKQETVAAEEIEIETIEIETDDEPAASASASSGQQQTADAIDEMKITDMTRELYEQGINFSDCLDAKSLRQRFRDYKSGRVSPGTMAGGARASSTAAPNTEQPRMPQRSHAAPQQQQQQQSYQQPPPNTGASGLTQDPYPNAHRKMIDPMKCVWQVKQELAIEKGIDPTTVDLWSGKVKLEDQKRLYDYPSIQSYPIEVRQKGDIPY